MLTARELSTVRDREVAVYRRAKLIFTMSERLRRSFMEDFGIPPERLITVHCGPNMLAPPPIPVREPSAVPRILFVGRDFERKGGPHLLEAFEEVHRRMPEARLRIVGGRPARGATPAGVEFQGYLSRDTAHGRDAMDEAYRTATVFCIPTRFEPFGTSFVEAMMYGVPCVGPAMWAVPEIIAHGETGLLVPPGDSSALAESLLLLLSDQKLARQMGEAGRARAERHFSWRGVARRMSTALGPVVRDAATRSR